MAAPKHIPFHMVLLKCDFVTASLSGRYEVCIPSPWTWVDHCNCLGSGIWQKWQFVINWGWGCYKRHSSFYHSLWDCFLWGKPAAMPGNTLAWPHEEEMGLLPAPTHSCVNELPWKWTLQPQSSLQMVGPRCPITVPSWVRTAQPSCSQIPDPRNIDRW